MWKEGMEMCGPFGRYLMKRYMRSWCSTEGHLKLMIRSALFLSFFFLINLFFKFYFIFKLYIIVLVLPNIKMNPPQVYM